MQKSQLFFKLGNFRSTAPAAAAAAFAAAAAVPVWFAERLPAPCPESPEVFFVPCPARPISLPDAMQGDPVTRAGVSRIPVSAYIGAKNCLQDVRLFSARGAHTHRLDPPYRREHQDTPKPIEARNASIYILV